MFVEWMTEQGLRSETFLVYKSSQGDCQNEDRGLHLFILLKASYFPPFWKSWEVWCSPLKYDISFYEPFHGDKKFPFFRELTAQIWYWRPDCSFSLHLTAFLEHALEKERDKFNLRCVWNLYEGYWEIMGIEGVETMQAEHTSVEDVSSEKLVTASFYEPSSNWNTLHQSTPKFPLVLTYLIEPQVS